MKTFFDKYFFRQFLFDLVLNSCNHQLFSLRACSCEVRRTAFVIESLRLLTTMATSSPRLFSAESLRPPAMLLAKLWALSALSTPRSGGMLTAVFPPAPPLIASALVPAFLLPPRDNKFSPMLAKLELLDSESVRRNLLK